MFASFSYHVIMRTYKLKYIWKLRNNWLNILLIGSKTLEDWSEIKGLYGDVLSFTDFLIMNIYTGSCLNQFLWQIIDGTDYILLYLFKYVTLFLSSLYQKVNDWSIPAAYQVLKSFFVLKYPNSLFIEYIVTSETKWQIHYK